MSMKYILYDIEYFFSSITFNGPGNTLIINDTFGNLCIIDSTPELRANWRGGTKYMYMS